MLLSLNRAITFIAWIYHVISFNAILQFPVIYFVAYTIHAAGNVLTNMQMRIQLKDN